MMPLICKKLTMLAEEFNRPMKAIITDDPEIIIKSITGNVTIEEHGNIYRRIYTIKAVILLNNIEVGEFTYNVIDIRRIIIDIDTEYVKRKISQWESEINITNPICLDIIKDIKKRCVFTLGKLIATAVYVDNEVVEFIEMLTRDAEPNYEKTVWYA